MPEIPAGAQIFDVVFHPRFSTVYTGLLTGHIKAFSYDDQGNHKQAFSLRPSKKSCRGLALDDDGSHLYAVGKSKALNIIDTVTEGIDIVAKAHDSPINRVKHLMPWILATGDDEGVIKLWDTRQKQCTRTYTQHFDYISDFLWLQDKKQLVATSGDGTLSIMDVRSKKPEPIAQSEDQEDELLSIVAIKGGTKVVVGTQLGILSIFNRSSGWGDCVDRVPGHPLSVDALCTLPALLPNVDTASTILTGSSDGYVRAVQILPTKLLGVVADHGEWPIERIAIGGGEGQLTLDQEDEGTNAKPEKSKKDESLESDDEEAEVEERQSQHGRWWVGSVGHEDVLRMTDLEGFFRDKEKDDESGKRALGMAVGEGDSDTGDGASEKDPENEPEGEASGSVIPTQDSDGDDSAEDSDEPKVKKRKRKPEKDPLTVKKKKGKNSVAVEGTFFDDL
ncbi:WD repeat-containing protein JIP5 [Crucibulum laeve]|uniref:WD repeat-containing protein JIP5 n=1 Tax=Crucibulum laeve TaxID=68775 RepID=A0A5C3LFR4_9AGAR|nr:WD repeat-containing protein JIP5 [Crucibulum laeve]